MSEPKLQGKSYDIPKQLVWKAWLKVRSKGGAAGADGVTIVKVMLHISSEEQRNRLLARLEDHTKHWKFNPADVDERQLWPAYRRAYEIAIERTNTEHAPWLVVPGDRKWYGKLAVAQVLLETLRRMNPAWPPPDYHIGEQKRRLAEEDRPA